MANYVILGKFTQQGIQTVKDSAKRRAKARELAASLGASITQAYATMGRYDLVILAQAPDDEAALKLAVQVGMQGNITTETMRAFDESEFDDALASI